MAPGNASGAIAIASTAAGSPSTIDLSATVVTPVAQISVNPASLSFGGTAIGVTATQNVTLTNAGNSNVTISSVSTTGAGFSASGVSNVALAPNQTVGVAVSFDPTGPGFVTGSLIVTSDAPQELVGLSGAGAAPHQHSVTLNWSPSASVVIGYNVYRGTGANAQLSKLSTSIDAATNYVDTAVVAGQSYTYAVTAVGTDGVESAPSTPVSVIIP
jgi:hypothetical protein